MLIVLASQKLRKLFRPPRPVAKAITDRWRTQDGKSELYRHERC